MNEKVIKRVNECGLQKKFIAEKLGVSSSTFSMWLTEERTIPEKKLADLKNILSRQEQLNYSLTKIA